MKDQLDLFQKEMSFLNPDIGYIDIYNNEELGKLFAAQISIDYADLLSYMEEEGEFAAQAMEELLSGYSGSPAVQQLLSDTARQMGRNFFERPEINEVIQKLMGDKELEVLANDFVDSLDDASVSSQDALDALNNKLGN